MSNLPLLLSSLPPISSTSLPLPSHSQSTGLGSHRKNFVYFNDIRAHSGKLFYFRSFAGGKLQIVFIKDDLWKCGDLLGSQLQSLPFSITHFHLTTPQIIINCTIKYTLQSAVNSAVSVSRDWCVPLSLTSTCMSCLTCSDHDVTATRRQ